MTESINRSHVSDRARGEKGFVLVSALVISLLFIGLIEMVLIDSSSRMRTAQRFRARTVAEILAENGAELAAQNMVNAASASGEAELAEGELSGELARMGETFILRGTGVSSGVHSATVAIEIRGRIGEDGTILIDSSEETR